MQMQPLLLVVELELRELLHKLEDQLRKIVILILHGHTNAEIAALLEVSERTVERKRVIIRRRWENELS